MSCNVRNPKNVTRGGRLAPAPEPPRSRHSRGLGARAALRRASRLHHVSTSELKPLQAPKRAGRHVGFGKGRAKTLERSLQQVAVSPPNGGGGAGAKSESERGRATSGRGGWARKEAAAQAWLRAGGGGRQEGPSCPTSHAHTPPHHPRLSGWWSCPVTTTGRPCPGAAGSGKSQGAGFPLGRGQEEWGSSEARLAAHGGSRRTGRPWGSGRGSGGRRCRAGPRGTHGSQRALNTRTCSRVAALLGHPGRRRSEAGAGAATLRPAGGGGASAYSSARGTAGRRPRMRAALPAAARDGRSGWASAPPGCGVAPRAPQMPGTPPSVQGMWASPARPPTTPTRTSRIRLFARNSPGRTSPWTHGLTHHPTPHPFSWFCLSPQLSVFFARG